MDADNQTSTRSPWQPPDSHHLLAAQGWLELGNPLEAGADLDRISLGWRNHPDVLELRLNIHTHSRQWDACVEIAGAIIQLDPNRPDVWTHRSFALHEMKRTQEALDHLLPVADKFPRVWIVPYNLACYCAQLGRMAECHEWFKKAMSIDEKTVRLAAAKDPDLKPLWDSV